MIDRASCVVARMFLVRVLLKCCYCVWAIAKVLLSDYLGVLDGC